MSFAHAIPTRQQALRRFACALVLDIDVIAEVLAKDAHDRAAKLNAMMSSKHDDIAFFRNVLAQTSAASTLSDSAILAKATPLADALLRRLFAEQSGITHDKIQSAQVSAHKPSLADYHRLTVLNRLRLESLKSRDNGFNDRQGTPDASSNSKAPSHSFRQNLPLPYADNFLACLASLPLEQREVLALVVLEGLAYPQVADCLQLSLTLVLSRLMQAREFLTTQCQNSALQIKPIAATNAQMPRYPVFPNMTPSPPGTSPQKPTIVNGTARNLNHTIPTTTIHHGIHYKKTSVPYLRVVT